MKKKRFFAILHFAHSIHYKHYDPIGDLMLKTFYHAFTCCWQDNMETT